MNVIARTALLWAVLLLTACAIYRPVDVEREAARTEARELVRALGAKNHTLSRFKGTGRLKLWQDGKSFSTRAAWVGSYPDKLRIALINPAGRPMASLSTDGKYLYMVSHADGEFYKKPSSNPTFQRFILIPISADDLITILAGRVPLRKHQTVEITADASGRGTILTLAKKWRGVVQKIFLDADKRSVLQIEIFRAEDELSYRTVFQGKQLVNGFELPERIIVSDDEGNRFELDIDRYWTDVSLPPSIFVLTPPRPEKIDP